MILFVLSRGENGQESCRGGRIEDECGHRGGPGPGVWGGAGAIDSALRKALSAPQLRDKERQMIKERFKVSGDRVPLAARSCVIAAET